MDEYIRCTNCKGTGRVPAPHGSKRYERCPICNGTGKKKKKLKGGHTNEYH